MNDQAIITSLQNPRVKSLVKLRDQRGRRKAGLFIAEGNREVQRAVQAGLRVVSVWVCNTFTHTPDQSMMHAEAWGLKGKTDIVRVSESVFKKIAYTREPEGVLAVCEPPNWSLQDVLKPGVSSFDLVAVGTEKPGNLGAMVRTAELAGCRSVIAAGTRVDAMNPNAIRASTGAVFTLPTLAMDEQQAIDRLHANRVRIIAAVVDADIQHTQANYTGACAIVIGPEDKGLSYAWKQAARQTGGATVRIPTVGRSADSLNASVAAGILLFEAKRQRDQAPLQ